MVTYKSSEGVGELLLSRPPVNALTLNDLRELIRILNDAEGEEDLLVLKIRAEGQGFSAGLDQKEMQRAAAHEQFLEYGLVTRRFLKALTDFPLPVVSVVRGFCMGLGTAIVAASDLVVASTDATFGLPEEAWSVAYLARIVPPAKLREMTMLGNPITAAQLHSYGSLARLVPDRDCDDATDALIATLSRKSARSLRAGKRKLQLVGNIDHDRAFWLEQGVMWSDESWRE
ncbi:MAG TPA: enoyl-CoA hydratase-related protein [Amycolatopsis sp.]|nr:enoyl-CoA hydratase-related protein [Amycolatopsis sp.]